VAFLRLAFRALGLLTPGLLTVVAAVFDVMPSSKICQDGVVKTKNQDPSAILWKKKLLDSNANTVVETNTRARCEVRAATINKLKLSGQKRKQGQGLKEKKTILKTAKLTSVDATHVA
jgi:hypothetical protein